MEKKVLIDNKAVNVGDTKTVISFKKPTPKWAKDVLKITIVLTTAVSLWVAGTNLIAATSKFEVVLVLKCIDALVLGFSRIFGVDVKKD